MIPYVLYGAFCLIEGLVIGSLAASFAEGRSKSAGTLILLSAIILSVTISVVASLFLPSS
jgi:hypothetical protein